MEAIDTSSVQLVYHILSYLGGIAAALVLKGSLQLLGAAPGQELSVAEAPKTSKWKISYLQVILCVCNVLCLIFNQKTLGIFR